MNALGRGNENCEWNPVEDRAATNEDKPHGPATWSVGNMHNWHLCDTCAALPRFRRMTRRRPLGSTTEKVIAELPPQDGREWDCQCARCGSSVGTDDADTIDLGRIVWRFCLSGAEWCKANPRPGREQVEPGAIEWFTFERGAR